MDLNYVDHLTDKDEVPELGEEFKARSVSFSELPSDLQEVLRAIQRGDVTTRRIAPEEYKEAKSARKAS